MACRRVPGFANVGDLSGVPHQRDDPGFLKTGVTDLRFAFEGSIEWAVSAIAAAAVLDGLDGRIARALKGTSRFGAELDSLADFVDFGVAPALVLYLSGLEKLKALGWMATLVFAIACSLRLARFNVMIYDPDLPPWRRTLPCRLRA